MFSILGFLAKETGKPIEQFATSGMVTRIFNSCEVLIETWVTVWNHEACRGMPNSYLSDGIFNLHRKTIMDFFSCMFFLRQLHLDLNMCFINFTLNNYIFFRSRKVR